MPRESLGEFEQLVLLGILHLAAAGDDDVYGVPIVDEIQRRTDRPVSRVAVYTALRRPDTERVRQLLNERSRRRARRQIAAISRVRREMFNATDA